jgi:hypothetical protein
MSEQDIELDVNNGEEVFTLENDAEDEQQTDNSRGDESDENQSEDRNEGTNDSELADAEDDDEREAIRARRREERKHRKEAQRGREDTLRRELASRDAVINQMRTELNAINNRNTGAELAQIENGKKQAVDAYRHFKDQIRVATEQNNGAAVADATEKMMLAQRRFDELQNIEKVFKQRQSAPQPLDPRLAAHAQSWMSKNSWYDPSGKDQDSEITMRIDQRLSQEGWDPTTPEYWEELGARVKKYLPHRTNSVKIAATKPKSVVSGGGREASNGSAKEGATYKLSSERVQALKDAGMWEDPKKRAEAVKRFRDYDKQHKA